MAAAAMIVGVLLPASVIGGVPPPDVQGVFDDVAIPFIHESAPPGAPSVFEDVNGITHVNELFVFTPAYLHGGVIGPAYRPNGEWIATITADFVAVGTVRVRTADGVDPYVSQWNGDAELAGRLAEAVEVDIVEDEPTGAFYVVFGNTIGPLNDAAETVLPTPTTLEEFQQILVARLAPEDAAEASDPLEPGSILAIVGIVLAVVAGTAVLISARVRGRRSARGSTPAG